ncbi:MAG: hypothetical protein BWY09_02212 [Candidatus Hydrogenedentes bacterium ADurb.Bin179]|nr:MAG: hypothetical protein BWY09_02212 [Candidatus Hydrogenedentes bacterium ADurb.Bin179]
MLGIQYGLQWGRLLAVVYDTGNILFQRRTSGGKQFSVIYLRTKLHHMAQDHAILGPTQFEKAFIEGVGAKHIPCMNGDFRSMPIFRTASKQPPEVAVGAGDIIAYIIANIRIR